MEGVDASPDPYETTALTKVGSSVLRGDIVQQFLCQDVPTGAAATWRALSNACLARVYFQLAHRLLGRAPDALVWLQGMYCDLMWPARSLGLHSQVDLCSCLPAPSTLVS